MGNTGSTEVSNYFGGEINSVKKIVEESKEHADDIMQTTSGGSNEVYINGTSDSEINISQSNEIVATQKSSLCIDYITNTNVSEDIKLDAIRTITNEVENSKLIGKTGAYSDSELKISNETYQKVCNEMAYVLNTITETAVSNKIVIENVDNSEINISQVNKANISNINNLMSKYASSKGYDYTSIIDEKEDIRTDIIANGFVTEFSKMINDLVGNVTDFFGSLGINAILLLLSPIIIIIVIVVLILLIKLIYKYLNNKIKSKEQIQQPTEQQIQN